MSAYSRLTKTDRKRVKRIARGKAWRVIKLFGAKARREFRRATKGMVKHVAYCAELNLHLTFAFAPPTTNLNQGRTEVQPTAD